MRPLKQKDIWWDGKHYEEWGLCFNEPTSKSIDFDSVVSAVEWLKKEVMKNTPSLRTERKILDLINDAFAPILKKEKGGEQ